MRARPRTAGIALFALSMLVSCSTPDKLITHPDTAPPHEPWLESNYTVLARTEVEYKDRSGYHTVYRIRHRHTVITTDICSRWFGPLNADLPSDGPDTRCDLPVGTTIRMERDESGRGDALAYFYHDQSHKYEVSFSITSEEVEK